MKRAGKVSPDKKQLLDLMMRTDNPLSLAWKRFRLACGRMEILSQKADIFTIRQAELDETIAILRAYGVEVSNEPDATENR